MELEETLIDQHTSIKEFEKEVKILRESKRNTELEFNRALQKREKEYQELENKLRQETEAKIDETQIQMSTNSSGLTSLESKRMEKKKNDKTFSTEAYEDSKRKLSKMMSQLERKLVLEEKKNLSLANLIDQSKAEKEQYKQKYNNLRQKIKQDECNQLRMSKMASMEPTPYGISTIPEIPGQTNSKLADYKDMRKDRKMSKRGHNEPGQLSTTDNLLSFLGGDQQSTKDKRSNMLKMRSAMSTEQTNANVFDRLLSHSTITSRIKQNPPIAMGDDAYTGVSQSNVKGRSSSFNMEIEGIDQSQLLWSCDLTVENPHNGPIYSVASLENQLYTSGKKSLKIWDIDTMTCISDIAAHSGIIKSLCVLPEQKLLASASDKVIILWDLVSLTNVATLKAHKGDINVLKRGSSILVSGGASGFNHPGLYVWDLRTSNPIEEREK